MVATPLSCSKMLTLTRLPTWQRSRGWQTQVRVCCKRFIVVKEVADKFTMLFVENTQSEVVGDPLDSKTTVGPLVRDSQRQALAKQVDDAKCKGGQGANRWQGYQ